MIALIIGNGNDINKSIIDSIKYDYVVCADGGLEKAKNYGITPDVIVGDFDSVDLSLLNEYEALNIPIMKFPAEKDYTDMELAAKFVLSKGFKDIVLIGASGSRLDHTLGNIMLMEKYHKEGINISMIDNSNIIKVISDDSRLIVEFLENQYVSIIPITELEGLTLEGFKYPLNNVNVERGSTLCISNEVIGKEGIITLSKGSALVFISKD
ncbi:MAG TPA: thiamine diphosphokinase [Tissierellia bacterium]|nr:thiamine diphosphokinase [Tissierellia bacterium]